MGILQEGEAVMDRTEKCDNPRCERMTAPNVSYCCSQCGKSHQGSYGVALRRIHDSESADWVGHSAMCDAREVPDKDSTNGKNSSRRN